MGFKEYMIKKIISRFFVFFIVVSLVFILPRLLPGGAFAYLIENPNIPPETREELIKSFGLDQPLHIQYIRFLHNFFLKGDLGISFRYLKPVTEVIMEALPWSILLVTSSTIISFTMGILLGAYSAAKRGRVADSIITNSVMVFRSMPSFWLGLILLLVFGYYLGWFPLYGAYTYGAEYSSFVEYLLDVLYHLTLPLITLVLIQMAGYTLFTRNTMLDVITEDFIVTARAKGLSERKVVYGHALRPVLPPVITVFAINLGFSVGGALIAETVFSYPGVGRLMYEAVYTSDYPLLLGIFVYISAFTLTAITVAEILYGWIDPRIRRG